MNQNDLFIRKCILSVFACMIIVIDLCVQCRDKDVKIEKTKQIIK